MDRKLLAVSGSFRFRITQDPNEYDKKNYLDKLIRQFLNEKFNLKNIN